MTLRAVVEALAVRLYGDDDNPATAPHRRFAQQLRAMGGNATAAGLSLRRTRTGADTDGRVPPSAASPTPPLPATAFTSTEHGVSGAVAVNVTAVPVMPDGRVWRYRRHLGTPLNDDVADVDDVPTAPKVGRQGMRRAVTTDVVVSFETPGAGASSARATRDSHTSGDGATQPGRVLSVRSRGTVVVQGAMDHATFAALGHNVRDWSMRPVLNGGRVTEEFSLQYTGSGSDALHDDAHADAVARAGAALDAFSRTSSHTRATASVRLAQPRCHHVAHARSSLSVQ